MLIECIDHVVVPVASLEAAAGPFERLGLRLTPPTRHRGRGTENRVFFVGSGSNDFYVELLGVHDRGIARPLYNDAIDRGGGAIALLMLAVNDIHTAVEALAGHGIRTAVERVFREDGTPICDAAPIDHVEALGFAAGLIQYVEPRAAAHTRHKAAGNFNHTFPLKRLDHLAAMAPDLEASTRFWVDVLGVAVHGEVRGPGIIIRQFKMGDATLELLAADGLESRLAGRPPGVSSMCAFEVPDLDAAVALARERGFTPSDPNGGILPGTRTATIPGGEFGGLALQLLEYV
jgi:catechol 2,3-dioxygenase-like lactoylglutathione lyase family enzyme